ncbi:TatD DNase family protein [Paenibacillus rhizosphaerae]|uniref:TatD DNase family protein n=1 Tax=Paenibacillus rhizosphaerae TaxID=297318 RepID=A0A839TYE6_9BACL|nr:TatD family hydrolase [Paenibacillus rhizosphaerae]MBB3131513.1 TatD DNase family protein [Paenibacillus rhizosphaerae]
MTLPIIDIGVNLMNSSFDRDREEVLARAAEAGVEQMIITGTCVESSEEAARYAKSYPGRLFSTAGVHPHDAKDCGLDTIERLRRLAGLPEVVAIGECGLDYNRDFSPRDVQRRWFEEQLRLAEELDMPLFLHERDAHADFAAMLRDHPALIGRAVVHCFTGSAEELYAYLEMGLHIGITGWICDERRGGHLRELVRDIPLERLMIETDAPYLTPRDLRPKPKGGRNEPAFLAHILGVIADCRGEEPAALAAATTRTTRRFFRI